jgi:hypothetical protein
VGNECPISNKEWRMLKCGGGIRITFGGKGAGGRNECPISNKECRMLKARSFASAEGLAQDNIGGPG